MEAESLTRNAERWWCGWLTWTGRGGGMRTMATQSRHGAVVLARNTSCESSTTFHKRTVRSAPHVTARSRTRESMACTGAWWPYRVSTYLHRATATTTTSE